MPDINDYITAAVRGGFPEVAYRDRSESSRSIWLTSYLDDLITRDAAMLDSTKDPAKLRHYLGVLALNNAGTPADATLYRAAGINARTAAAYDQLLRNLYVLDIVPAWANGRLNRLVKTGKRYMVDSGLAAAAANLTTEIILDDSDLVGRFFDAFATAQIRPEAGLVHPRPALHHLRTAAGRQEIDLVIELGATRVVGIEFKAGSAPTADDAKHLSWLRDELGQGFTAGAVLHSGPGIYPLGDRIYAIPLCALWG
jgi:predicted AAA+ superfamily ATPase